MSDLLVTKKTKQILPRPKKTIPKPSSGSVYRIKYKEAVVNFPAWSQAVMPPGSRNFIYPAILETSLEMLAGPEPPTVVAFYDNYRCQTFLMMREHGTKRTVHDVVSECERRKLSFIIVHLDVKINDEGRTVLTETALRNHVIQVYLHRKSSLLPWFVTICDPNWAPLYKSSSKTVTEATINRNHESDLYQIGVYFLQLFDKSVSQSTSLHDRVFLHRCLNVNICVPLVGTGICFTGLCAALVASDIYAELYPENKAINGDQLMLLIRRATMAARSKAASFVEAYHTESPLDRQRMSEMLSAAVKTGLRDSVSPERYTSAGVKGSPLRYHMTEAELKRRSQEENGSIEERLGALLKFQDEKNRSRRSRNSSSAALSPPKKRSSLPSPLRKSSPLRRPKSSRSPSSSSTSSSPPKKRRPLSRPLRKSSPLRDKSDLQRRIDDLLNSIE